MNIISILIRLLSLAVIVLNLLYLRSGGNLSLNGYLNFMEPYFIYLMPAIILGSIVILLFNTTKSMTKVILILIIIAALFPLIQPYLMKLKYLLF